MERIFTMGVYVGVAAEAGSDPAQLAADTKDHVLAIAKKEKAQRSGPKGFDANKELEALAKAGKLKKSSGVIMELLRPEAAK
jgi:hypothetical protein